MNPFNYKKKIEEERQHLLDETHVEIAQLRQTWSEEENTRRDALKKQEEALLERERGLELQRREFFELQDTANKLRTQYEEKLEEANKRLIQLDENDKALRLAQDKLREQQQQLEDKRQMLEGIEQRLDRRTAELDERYMIVLEKEAAAENPPPTDQNTPSTMPLPPVSGDLPEEININASKIPDIIVRLPNAMVGKNYTVNLNEIVQDARFVLRGIHGLETLNLEYSSALNTLNGEPTLADDHTLVAEVAWKIPDPPNAVKLQLLVNPDPKSLWKNLPTDPDAPFPKNDTDHFQKQFSAGRVVLGASKRGRSHAHTGAFRDDHILARTLDNGWLLLAVADGAGSATYSREGSKLACEHLLESLSNGLTTDSAVLDELIKAQSAHQLDQPQKELKDQLYQYIGTALYQAINAIVASAKAHDHELRDYSSTLLFSMVKQFDNQYFMASYAVGDGAIGLLTGEGIQLLAEPDAGEFAGQTRFITMKEIKEPADIYKRIKYLSVEDFQGLFLLTDGVTDPIFVTDSQLVQAHRWQAFYQELKDVAQKQPDAQPEALLDWLDFWSPGNHDDRSMIVVW